MFRARHLRLMLRALLAIPGDQPRQFIAVRAIALERLFIEQPLRSASQADLVAVPGGTYWPAHAAMPASPKQNCRSG